MAWLVHIVLERSERAAISKAAEPWTERRPVATVDEPKVSGSLATASASPERSKVAAPQPNAALARVPVQNGGKGWRFERLPLNGVSAASLYDRISESGVSTANIRDVLVFAELSKRCREQARRARVNDGQRADFDLVDECTGAPSDASAKSDEWLTQAAELGDSAARYMYANLEHLSWVGTPTEIYKNPERLIEYKPKSLSYLKALSMDGHVDSMMRLSNMYFGGVYGDDQALSWAYANAAMRASGNHSAMVALNSQLAKLSPEEQTRARQEADRIFSACCR